MLVTFERRLQPIIRCFHRHISLLIWAQAAEVSSHKQDIQREDGE